MSKQLDFTIDMINLSRHNSSLGEAKCMLCYARSEKDYIGEKIYVFLPKN